MLDLLNKKFGKLSVIQKTDMRSKYGDIQWLCKCDCGNQIIRAAGALNSGANTSCGCENGQFKPKHGFSGTPLYSIWNAMIARCYRKNCKEYKYYGKRGIKIYEKWKNDFLHFQEWAIVNNYEGGLTIERINVNGDYEPKNCKWVKFREQSRNKRNNVWLTIDNKTQIMKDWAVEKNICHKKVSARLKLGWSAEEALGLIKRNN